MHTDRPLRLDLKPFFRGRTDYAIIRLGDVFPEYVDYSDVDVLCEDSIEFLRNVLSVGAEYERQGFTISTHATGRQLHVDFYPPGAERLAFRFDLFETFDSYTRFSLSGRFTREIFERKRVVVRDGLELRVPAEDDDLALRFLEYLQFKDERPDKRKHLQRVIDAGSRDFIARIERHTDLRITDDASGPDAPFAVCRVDGATLPEAVPGEPLYERFFSQRRNGCVVSIGDSGAPGARDGAAALADGGWTARTVDRASLSATAAPPDVAPGFELLIANARGGDWNGLRCVDLAAWRPEMVAVAWLDRQTVPVSPDTLEEVNQHLEARGYVAISDNGVDSVYVSRQKLSAARERMDCFLIWGHGLPMSDDIVARIRRRRDLEILAVHRNDVGDVPKFVANLYACDAVPFEHLRDKTRYLLTTPGTVVLIVVRNHNPQERYFGDGAFHHIQCALIKDVKEEIRNAHNPRVDGKRTEHHVIHATDYESQVAHTLQLMALPPMEFYRRRPHAFFDVPYHLGPFRTCRAIELPLHTLRARIIGVGVVPIDHTPHFQYVSGDRQPYEAYHARYMGTALTDDHFPSAFDRLIREFDDARVCRADTRQPIVVMQQDGEYVIQDGVHRAAILAHRGDASVPVLEIVPEEDARPQTSIAILVFSKDRALQLDATLRSLKMHCLDVSDTQISVLYTTSTPRHRSQYEHVKLEHPNVRFLREYNFRREVLDVASSAKHLMFVVDDCLFVRKFRAGDGVDQLAQRDRALGVSWRLGRNTTYCYSFDRPQRVPEFTCHDDFRSFEWADAEFDFGYPLEVSSSLYRTRDLLPFLEALEFKDPNSLESVMAAHAGAFRDRHPELLCLDQSVAFCAPVNKVQTERPNRAGESPQASVDALADAYDRNRRIDVDAYAGFVPEACHQEIEIKFARRSARTVLRSIAKRMLQFGRSENLGAQFR